MRTLELLAMAAGAIIASSTSGAKRRPPARWPNCPPPPGIAHARRGQRQDSYAIAPDFSDRAEAIARRLSQSWNVSSALVKHARDNVVELSEIAFRDKTSHEAKRNAQRMMIALLSWADRNQAILVSDQGAVDLPLDPTEIVDWWHRFGFVANTDKNLNGTWVRYPASKDATTWPWQRLVQRAQLTEAIKRAKEQGELGRFNDWAIDCLGHDRLSDLNRWLRGV